MKILELFFFTNNHGSSSRFCLGNLVTSDIVQRLLKETYIDP